VTAAEWLGAAVLLGALALFLWRSGAPPRQIALILTAAALGILATAAVWAYFESRE
jgi:hypothetical protein